MSYNTDSVCDYITLFFGDGTADGNELKWYIPVSAYLSNAKGLVCKVSITDGIYTNTEDKQNLNVCYDGVMNAYSPTTEATNILGHFTKKYEDSKPFIQTGTVAANSGYQGTVTFDEAFSAPPQIISELNAGSDGNLGFSIKHSSITTTSFDFKKVYIREEDGTYTFVQNNASIVMWAAIGTRATSKVSHQFIKNDVEYLVSARPNQIKLKFYRQNNVVVNNVSRGYVTLKFEYLDPDTTKQNSLNQEYESAFPQRK